MPACTIAEALREKTKEIELIYVGTKGQVEESAAARYNISFYPIKTGKLRRYFSIKNFTDLFRITAGFFQSLRIINKFKPDILFSTGGFVSVPPVIAASIKKIPIVIHEQTIEVGLANRIASKFAKRIALSFEESTKYFDESKVTVTGQPIRKELFSGNREECYKSLELNSELPLIYFTGGGLGCHILNETATEIIEPLLERANIVFQTGNSPHNSDYEEILEFSKGIKSRGKLVVFDFVKSELSDILAACDLAVARSGAGTVSEFRALKIPAIFIPLAIATKNEQFKNAMSLCKRKTALIIEEKNLTAETLKNEILRMLKPENREKIKEAYKSDDFKNGTDSLLKIILEETVKIKNK